MKKPFYFLLCMLLVMTLISGCSEKPTPTITLMTPTPEISSTPADTATPAPPTATPAPLAASVNGDGITLAEFQAELARYQKAQQDAGIALPTEAEQHRIVLDEMVDDLLLVQAAYTEGFVLSDTDYQARLAKLAEQAGGDASLAEWLAQNGYTPQSFEAAFKRSIASAWKRDQVAAAVPSAAEQVHVQQILIYDKATADRVLADIRAGLNFATYAIQFDTLTGGELGWFPRGFLTMPEVEAAAFALQPGDISEVIKSEVGYHILYVIDREGNRLLSPDTRQALQRLAVAQWMTETRKVSVIKILVP